MADSAITVATPGGNVNVKTDEFPPGSHTERVKVQTGSTGQASDVHDGNPMPVKDVTAPFAGPVAQSGADVTTSSGAVVSARAGRALLVIVNSSDTAVWLALDAAGGGSPAAVVGSGYWLGPNGGSWSEAYTGAVRAIHGGSGSKRLGVVEW